MTRNYKFGIGAFILVLTVASLMFAGVQEDSMYYFTIEEFLPQRESLQGQGLRVAGRVSAGSLSKNTSASGTAMKFRVQDFTNESDGESVPVEYTGVVPDMFAEGRDVILEGKYVGGVFLAQTVMTSCPSKYEPGAEG